MGCCSKSTKDSGAGTCANRFALFGLAIAAAVHAQEMPPTPHPVPAPAGAKNVLFFAVDDLRPEITAFGPIPGTVQPTMSTPHFDLLASKSLVLTKNYVQQAVCSPTRQSLLTGRRPDRTRVYDLYSNFRTVAANYTTIPEFFKSNGYTTIGMGKIFHPGHASGDHVYGKGDDLCCSWSNTNFYYHAPNLGSWSGSTNTSHHGGKAWFNVDAKTEAEFPLPDNQTADNAVATLKNLSVDFFESKNRSKAPKPWFVAVGFHKPHLPFVASSKFFDQYPPSGIELPPDQLPPKGMPHVAWSAYGELRNYVGQNKSTAEPGTVQPESDVLALRRAYYASVSALLFFSHADQTER
jgi:iduronate 2-sulfatase